MAARAAKKNARGKAKPATKGEPGPVRKDEAQLQRTTQLATRVRDDIHMAMKIHVVKTGGTIMDFVESAVLRELARVGSPLAA